MPRIVLDASVVELLSTRRTSTGIDDIPTLVDIRQRHLGGCHANDRHEGPNANLLQGRGNRFNGTTPEALVRGRERAYFEHFWNDFAADRKRSIAESDRRAYTAAYARPGRMRAGWAYFVSFPETAKHFAELSRRQLRMPVLAIGGGKANGALLASQMTLVASDVTVVILDGAGHWILEERPKETTEALVKFL